MGKGRGNRSSLTVNEVSRLEINHLVRSSHIQKGKTISFISSWTNGSSIGITSYYNDNDIYLRLKYSITDKQTKESKSFDYKIYIDKVKSNLGKGYNLYFICPESGKSCKILYLCYGAERFKCRQAYRNRIYYRAQTHSKDYRLNGRYFHLESTLNELYEKRDTSTYKGKPTKRSLRILKLSIKQAHVDELRYIQLGNLLINKFGVNL